MSNHFDPTITSVQSQSIKGTLKSFGLLWFGVIGILTSLGPARHIPHFPMIALLSYCSASLYAHFRIEMSSGGASTAESRIRLALLWGWISLLIGCMAAIKLGLALTPPVDLARCLADIPQFLHQYCKPEPAEHLQYVLSLAIPLILLISFPVVRSLIESFILIRPLSPIDSKIHSDHLHLSMIVLIPWFLVHCCWH